MEPSNWTLGVTVALPILTFLALVFLVLTVLAFWVARGDGDAGDFRFFGALCAVITLVIVGGSLYGYYPFKEDFHRYYKVHGTVQEVGHRQISNGDSGMSERYVLKINNTPFGVDDTRASLVKVGDTVDLKCKREYVFASVSGWACHWNG
jgi:hypothetical protein